MNKADKPIYIVSYITCLSSKRVIAQNASKESSEISEKPEVNIELDNSESLLDKLVSHKSIVGNNFLSVPESELPVIHSPEAVGRISKKCKQNVEELDASKRQSKKIRTEAKLSEVTSKPTRLYLLKNDDLALQVDCQEIKMIFKKESVLVLCLLSYTLYLKSCKRLIPLRRKHFALD